MTIYFNWFDYIKLIKKAWINLILHWIKGEYHIYLNTWLIRQSLKWVNWIKWVWWLHCNSPKKWTAAVDFCTLESTFLWILFFSLAQKGIIRKEKVNKYVLRNETLLFLNLKNCWLHSTFNTEYFFMLVASNGIYSFNTNYYVCSLIRSASLLHTFLFY